MFNSREAENNKVNLARNPEIKRERERGME